MKEPSKVHSLYYFDGIGGIGIAAAHVRTMKRRDGRTTNLPRRFRWQDDVDGNTVDNVGDNAVETGSF